MNDEHVTLDDLIEEIRTLLTAQGATGQWLLDRIDESLEDGIEDRLGSEPPRGLWDADAASVISSTSESMGESELEIRKPRDSWEVLERYLSVLEAYLVTLPASFDSAIVRLREWRVPAATLSLYNELGPDTLGPPPQTFASDEMFPFSWKRNAQMFHEIHRLLSELIREKDQVR